MYVQENHGKPPSGTKHGLDLVMLKMFNDFNALRTMKTNLNAIMFIMISGCPTFNILEGTILSSISTRLTQCTVSESMLQH